MWEEKYTTLPGMFTGKTKQVDESSLKDVFQFHGKDLYKAKTL